MLDMVREKVMNQGKSKWGGEGWECKREAWLFFLRGMMIIRFDI